MTIHPGLHSASTRSPSQRPRSPASRLAQSLARDADLVGTLAATVNYTLFSGDARFAVDALTGEILTTGLFDYDAPQNDRKLLLTLQSSDAAPPFFMSSAQVEVNFIDVNDNIPVISAPGYSASVAENTEPGAFLGSVSATDADTGRNAALKYAIVSGNTNNIFQIGEASGVVVTRGTIDFETLGVSSVTLSITATDQGIDVLGNDKFLSSTAVTMVITIVDINDNPPIFDKIAYTGQVTEGAVGILAAQVRPPMPTERAPTMPSHTQSQPAICSATLSSTPLVASIPLQPWIERLLRSTDSK